MTTTNTQAAVRASYTTRVLRPLDADAWAVVVDGEWVGSVERASWERLHSPGMAHGYRGVCFDGDRTMTTGDLTHAATMVFNHWYRWMLGPYQPPQPQTPRPEPYQWLTPEECPRCADRAGPTHTGGVRCRSGSLASGGWRPHCTCDLCF